MVDIAICTYCRKSVHLDDEIFVVVNKDQVAEERDWRYAHSACHLERAAAEVVTGPHPGSSRE